MKKSLKEILARPLTHDIVHYCSKCERPFPPNAPMPQPGEKPRSVAECPECGHGGCNIGWVGRNCLAVGDEREVKWPSDTVCAGRIPERQDILVLGPDTPRGTMSVRNERGIPTG